MNSLDPRVIQVKVMKMLAPAMMIQNQIEALRQQWNKENRFEQLTPAKFLHLDSNRLTTPSGQRTKVAFNIFRLTLEDAMHSIREFANNLPDDGKTLVEKEISTCTKAMGEWGDLALMSNEELENVMRECESLQDPWGKMAYPC